MKYAITMECKSWYFCTPLHKIEYYNLSNSDVTSVQVHPALFIHLPNIHEAIATSSNHQIKFIKVLLPLTCFLMEMSLTTTGKQMIHKLNFSDGITTLATLATLHVLAELGEIPKSLAKVPPPRCACCMLGATNKKPWRTKGPTNHIWKATRPSGCVFVDQLISTQHGFVAQLKGWLTNQHYRGATIFVDYFSQLQWIHFQMTLISGKTIQAKMAIEKFVAMHVVKVQRYNLDIAALIMMQSSISVGKTSNFLHSVVTMITSKMESLKEPSEMFKSKPRYLCSMLSTICQNWSYAACYTVVLYNVMPSQNDGRFKFDVFGISL